MQKGVWFSIFAVMLAAACSHPQGLDETPNRPPGDAVPADYPAGPYGFIVGSTLTNERFLGKTKVAGTPLSSTPLARIDFAQFHRDPEVKLLLIDGSALWCSWCRVEEPGIKMLAEQYADRGLRVMTIIAQGDTYGVSATEADLESWMTDYDLSHLAVLDPENRINQYGDLAAFPLHLLIRTSDMTLGFVALGGGGSAHEQIEHAIIDLLP